MTKTCVYDIEGDNLLVEASVVHCMVVYDCDTKEYFEYRPDEITEGYKKLQTYDMCIGHNALGYDKCCLEKLYADKLGPLPKHGDTFIMSRLLYAQKESPCPGGRHGLASWGQYFKYNKLDYSDWSVFTEEMLVYCKRDVEINVLTNTFLTDRWFNDLDYAYQLERDIRSIVSRQELNGFRLEPLRHQKLLRDLDVGLYAVRDKIDKIIEPELMVMSTPEYWIATSTNMFEAAKSVKFATKKEAAEAGYKSNEITRGPSKTKTIRFNPGSPKQVIDYFKTKYNWVPVVFTEAGNPSMTGTILENLAFEEADLFGEYQMLIQRISQVSSWVNFVRGDRVHGHVRTVGTATFRMSHADPNIAQVTAKGKKWGAECRSCWVPKRGWKLVGTDAKGLELRMLANALQPYDNGLYIPAVCTGDPHEYNNKLADLGNRDAAKTIVYAFIYGGGLIKLGKLAKNSKSVADEARHVRLPPVYIRYMKEAGLYQDDNIEAAKRGLVIKKRFRERVTGFGDLLDALTAELSGDQKTIRGIDGRRIPVQKANTILNRRLQSDGAIVMKESLRQHYIQMYRSFGAHGKHWAYCANVHDEFQVECTPEIADQVAVIGCDAIKKAGEVLGLVCPLAGNSTIGDSWYATH